MIGARRFPGLFHSSSTPLRSGRGVRLPHRRFRPALFLAALFAAGSAFADETDCARRLKPVRVSVEAQPLSFSVDSSLPSRRLTALENKAPGQRGLGRTVTKFRNKATYDLSMLKLPGGRICVRPSVRVEISYEPTIVYVASEFPPGSCEHRFVLEHERTHILLYERQLGELAGQIRTDLLQLLGNDVLTFSDFGEATQQIAASARKVIRGRAASAREGAKREQAEIDSTEGISRLSDPRRLCASAETPTD